MQEVAGIHLVDRNGPQRRRVEVAQVLELALGVPLLIDVGQVVHRARRLRFVGPRRPHAGRRPAEELWRGGDGDSGAVGNADDRVAGQEGVELVELLTRGSDQGAGCRMLRLRFSPRFNRVAAIASAGQLAELFLRRRHFAHGNGQQAIDWKRNSLFQP